MNMLVSLGLPKPRGRQSYPGWNTLALTGDEARASISPRSATKMNKTLKIKRDKAEEKEGEEEEDEEEDEEEGDGE